MGVGTEEGDPTQVVVGGERTDSVKKRSRLALSRGAPMVGGWSGRWMASDDRKGPLFRRNGDQLPEPRRGRRRPGRGVGSEGTVPGGTVSEGKQ